MSELLFSDADDPLGALRWTLADVRRVLGDGARIEGNPLRLVLPPDASVDVEILTRGTWVEAVRLPTLGRDLIEGLDFPFSPGFELWLASERRRLGGFAEAVLREATLSSLADREPAQALEHASRLVRLNPYDENHHVLLVRSMSDLGDHDGAMRQVELSADLLRRELGLDSDAILRAAAAAEPVVGPSRDAPATVRALQEAGEAAIGAGALEAGLVALRQAVSGSRACDDRRLLAETLIALGSTLVHAARGTDEEGAAALYEGRTLADQIPDRDLGAKARRELAWIEFLRGRYDRALAWSAEAGQLAAGNDAELAWADLIAGGCHTDSGDYHAALPVLISAVDRADRAGAARTAAVAAALLGRLHLLRGETDAARPALERSLQQARVGRLDRLPAVAGIAPGRARPQERRRGCGHGRLRACLRPRLPGRRPLLGERRRARPGSHRRGEAGCRDGDRVARRSRAPRPATPRRVAMDGGLRARSAVLGRGGEWRSGGPPVDR